MLCHDYSYHGSRCEGGYSELLANAWNLLGVLRRRHETRRFLSQQLCWCMQCTNRLWESSHRKVLIIGAGFLGLILHVLATLDAGHEVWVTDKNAFKLDLLPPNVRKATTLDEIKDRCLTTFLKVPAAPMELCSHRQCWTWRQDLFAGQRFCRC